jgi:hypothetical protein
LTGGSPVQIIGGLDLHDDLAIDDHVHSLVGELLPPVRDTNADLTSYLMATVSELYLEREEMECVMHHDRAAQAEERNQFVAARSNSLQVNPP